MRKTIEQLKIMRESEDCIEFKKGEFGNVSYNGGNKPNPSERRKCILGYVTALCNEKGGSLVIGMHDSYPHKVVGTKQNEGGIGQLESDIYRDTGIRTDVYELFEEGKRVLVIDVPSRPRGRVFKFEDVPLMRVGEDLKPMSDEVYLSIIQEQEPDFSEQFCEGICFEDLDREAIQVLKNKYANKNRNPSFRSLNDYQALSDLGLVYQGKVTNAAVILVGKAAVIARTFPQAKISLEYRTSESNIHFDAREYFEGPYFLMIDRLWTAINSRNGSVPVRNGIYKDYDIPLFNEDVVREALNNAIAHRSYSIQGEIVVKQYPSRMVFVNPGGFPHGVTVENLLYVQSTPRNRLLADVLSKTGLVERSGQGVDNIYLDTLSEGKPAPDYSKTDDFCVTLILSSKIEDAAFSQYVNSIQESLPDDAKLTVYDVLTLNTIRQTRARQSLDKKIVAKLLNGGYIEQRGKTSGTYYILGKEYYELAGRLADYSKITDWDENQAFTMIASFLKNNASAKMGDFVNLLSGNLSRKQIRTYIEKLVDNGMLTFEGEAKKRTYSLNRKYKDEMALINKAVEIGLIEIREQTKGRKNGQ
jgi:ATP-dependent DNA helicase RecG